MKASTQIKMFVASIRSLNAAELKDLVASQFAAARKELAGEQTKVQKVLAQLFSVADHGYAGCQKAIESADAEKVAETQEAVASLVENTARFLEENEAVAKVVASFLKTLFQEATQEAQELIKADESLTLLK